MALYDTPKTFRCPNCKEMINDSMKNCRYCEVAIDPGIAELIAGRQELVNRACSEASYLRSTAIAMYVLIAISAIRVFAVFGVVIIFVVVVVQLIRWQMRYNNIISDDPDYPKAKKSRTQAFFLAVFALPIAIVVRVAVELLFISARGFDR